MFTVCKHVLDLLHLRLHFLIAFSHSLAFIRDAGATLSLVHYYSHQIHLDHSHHYPQIHFLILGGHPASLSPSKPLSPLQILIIQTRKSLTFLLVNRLTINLPSFISKLRLKRQGSTLFSPIRRILRNRLFVQGHITRRVHLRFVGLHGYLQRPSLCLTVYVEFVRIEMCEETIGDWNCACQRRSYCSMLRRMGVSFVGKYIRCAPGFCGVAISTLGWLRRGRG